jgi:hypothetical protein
MYSRWQCIAISWSSAPRTSIQTSLCPGCVVGPAAQHQEPSSKATQQQQHNSTGSSTNVTQHSSNTWAGSHISTAQSNIMTSFDGILAAVVCVQPYVQAFARYAAKTRSCPCADACLCGRCSGSTFFVERQLCVWLAHGMHHSSAACIRHNTPSLTLSQ